MGVEDAGRAREGDGVYAIEFTPTWRTVTTADTPPTGRVIIDPTMVTSAADGGTEVPDRVGNYVGLLLSSTVISSRRLRA